MEIIAHRGASHDAPENTLAAARLAWAQQADALECDVHLTRDGRLVVVHDDDLQRVGGRAMRIADATLAELREVDVGGGTNPDFRPEKIPELDELIAITPPSRRLFVELKGGPALVEELARSLARTRFDETRLVVISFNLEAVRRAKSRLPRTEVCWIVDREGAMAHATIAELVQQAQGAGLDGLDLDYQWPVDGAVVRSVHAVGMKLYVWTVDDVNAAYRLCRDGVDGIATNRPGWMRGELQKTV
ncbi:MAG: glycerophosphodiester phosphodiesterase [Opitutaceae bacterium]|nr:glycerophosphodiester phosphodiesterase [Opitutaceae bacterium]